MAEGEQAGASTAGANQQVGWCADDEWMDEYRAADCRGTRDTSTSSVRPGMAPEEEALIQVFSHGHADADAGFACYMAQGCLQSLLTTTLLVTMNHSWKAGLEYVDGCEYRCLGQLVSTCQNLQVRTNPKEKQHTGDMHSLSYSLAAVAHIHFAGLSSVDTCRLGSYLSSVTACIFAFAGHIPGTQWCDPSVTQWVLSNPLYAPGSSAHSQQRHKSSFSLCLHLCCSHGTFHSFKSC